jgi:hypothetical protein
MFEEIDIFALFEFYMYRKTSWYLINKYDFYVCMPQIKNILLLNKKV